MEFQDILPPALLIGSLLCVFWLIFHSFFPKKKKDNLSRFWAFSTLGLVVFFVLLSVGSYQSHQGFSELNALIWLALISPIVGISYFFYHIALLTTKYDKKAGKDIKKTSKEIEVARAQSKFYLVIFILIILLCITYPVARHWKDEQNAANRRKGNPYDCSVPTDFNNDYCTRLKNHLKLRDQQG